jgi:hypothetical protein
VKLCAIALLALAGCTLDAPVYYDYLTPTRWVYDYVTYTAVDGENWQTPDETLEKGTGDCEDFALLLMRIVYDTYHVKGWLIAYDTGKSFHAVAEFDGYYDATGGRRVDIDPAAIVRIWTYDEAMLVAQFL